MTGPVALVGSGEYLPVMTDTEALLLKGRPPVFVQIPTAAAPEGEESLARWVELGRQQAERLGVRAVPLVARDRDEADDPDLAAQVEGAGLVYLSGGNPPFLAATLRGTRLWDAVLATWLDGAALAGCSAGAIALTDWVPDIRNPDAPPSRGLGVAPHLRVIPHFDRFLQWMPDLVGRYLTDEAVVLGIDEDTALVQQDGRWTVHGRQSVWVLTADERVPYGAGEVVEVLNGSGAAEAS